MTVSEDDWEVAKHRVEAMPSHIKLAIGRSGSLSKDDIIKHIEKRDAIGERVVTMQINYLKFFKGKVTLLPTNSSCFLTVS